jgi:C4-dicarboxylate-specific signal transduction histidine kinase
MRILAGTSLRSSAFMRYTVPVVTDAGAALVTLVLQSVSTHVPGLPLLFCAAICSAWFGGLGPGLLAAVLSSGAIALNLVPPPSPGNSLAEELPRLVTFSIGVFFVSWISGRQRQAEQLLEQARDELEAKVRERTSELSLANSDLQSEIAERRSAEQALQTMQLELAHVSRVTMLGELTASIAHEVNQPLGAIMNYANACRRLLASGIENAAKVDEALSRIAGDAKRASDVIARIRALSARKPIARAKLTVRELVDEVLAIARYEIQARGVTVRADLAAGLPPLHVDRVQMQQVLLNLVMNSMEAVEGQPAKDRLIEISARARDSEDGPEVLMRVRDHGPGVDPGEADRLFEPFHSTKPQGLGMGLPISRSIVEAHGGRLNLVPCEGKGAAFEAVLPAGEGTAS